MPSFTFMSLLPQILLVNLQKNLEQCDFQEMEIDKRLKHQLLESLPYIHRSWSSIWSNQNAPYPSEYNIAIIVLRCNLRCLKCILDQLDSFKIWYLA